MLGGYKNITDKNSPLPNLPLNKGEEQGGGMSYTKTTKLVTAVYMVTDMIHIDEPLRNKLRTLGAEVISEADMGPARLLPKIAEILSFLDIAQAVNMISEMNSNILKKEFMLLRQSIQEVTQFQPSWIEKFLETPEESREEIIGGKESYKGHMRIGVQKGSTLMKALSDKTSMMSDRKNLSVINNNDLKKQRRESILTIIKILTAAYPNSQGHTITDIKSKAEGVLASVSEKTLQRELVSMVEDRILGKTGSKRWSRYSLIKS